MAVYIAHKTIAAIDNAIQADQGAAYRGWLGKVIPHIGDAYRTDEDGHRSHMGASIIGQECARSIWYSFHWAWKSNFSGRMIRLFNRGHLEEARFIAMLLTIGVQLWQQDNEGKQFRISWAEGHAGGSGDGVCLGLPDLPPQTHALLECKTHGEKSFIELAGKLEDWRKYLEDPTRMAFPGKGVKEAKPEHYAQMQMYMRRMGLAAALYVAVNKNTDDIYLELIALDIEYADLYLTRGEKIVWMENPPEKLSQSPGFWKCRFCDHKPHCHLKKAPDVNCRTCEFSKPIEGGKWRCGKKDMDIPKETQLTGCDQYALKTGF